MNSNAVNNAFAREAELLAARLGRRFTDLGPVAASKLVDRMVQMVLDIGRLPYARLALTDQLGPGAVIDLGCCDLVTGSGRLVLTVRQWLRGVAQYLVHWAYCLFGLLLVRTDADQRQGVVLVTGVSTDAIFQDGKDHAFAAYCRSCPVVPLREGRHLYVQTTAQAPASSDSRISYVRRPLIELMRRGRLGWMARMRAIVSHACGLPEFLWCAMRVPEFALLGRDIAYVRGAAALDDGKLLEAVVTTCSSITEQPLWGRGLVHAKVHMVWYAQNWKPVVFKADPVESDIPLLHWIRVDSHWVWTRKFADYLHKLVGPATMHAAGPLVWQCPGSVKPESNEFQIVVFDVSPYSNEVALSYCESPNYNNPDNLRKFIEDIVSLRPSWEAVAGRPVVLRVKTKRGYQSAYDRGYFEFLDELDSEGTIKLEHHAENIYDMISGSQVAIAYPFTSPPYLADAVQVPSVYYDPTGEILKQNFSDTPTLIEFATGKHQLHAKVLELLALKQAGRVPG
jgi:hypothetical protein